MNKYSIKTLGLAFLGLCITHISNGQILTNQAALTIQGGTQVFVQGDLLNEGTGEIANDGQIFIQGNITNNSSAALTSGNGETILNGSSEQTIGGSNMSRFGELSQNNGAGSKLDQSIEIVNFLTLQSGNINLNGQTIDLGANGEIIGEANDMRIFGSTGKIMAVRDLNAPNGASIAGMGVGITSSANLGSTTIERTHGIETVGSGASIERAFNIMPTNNSGLAATLRIDYFDNELNSQDPNLLNQWRLSSGATDWTPGNVANKGTPNFIEGGPYDAMALWTLSADGTSSIGDFLPQLAVKYYPNPMQSGNPLKIEGLETGEYNLVLTDVRGRKVWEANSKISSPGMIKDYNLPVLAEGVYSLQILSEKYAPVNGLIQIQQ